MLGLFIAKLESIFLEEFDDIFLFLGKSRDVANLFKYLPRVVLQ